MSASDTSGTAPAAPTKQTKQATRTTALLSGERVDLRPVEEEDLPQVHRWDNDESVSGAYDSHRPVSLDDVRRRYREHPALNADGGALMIACKDGVPVGMISCHRVAYGATSFAYNIGISIAPTERGKGYGGESQRLFADYLLATYPIGRVEASTDIENLAEQRALKRAGFQREGVARSASWRGGRWHDMVVYSRVQGDE